MISLAVLFWMYLLLFGVIGALRGWAKEILVLFSLFLALFLDAIVMKYVPGVEPALISQTSLTQFSVRAGFVFLLAFFGYSTPVVATLFADKARRETPGPGPSTPGPGRAIIEDGGLTYSLVFSTLLAPPSRPAHPIETTDRAPKARILNLIGNPSVRC